ncbi:hypothetical protein VSR68_20505 [Paraburkholderia phymatum]|uniref:hypothetical protein n=1 Tax=Paraburkholderia phymatum TaxID=148447 RepID=UPI00316F1CF2
MKNNQSARRTHGGHTNRVLLRPDEARMTPPDGRAERDMRRVARRKNDSEQQGERKHTERSRLEHRLRKFAEEKQADDCHINGRRSNGSRDDMCPDHLYSGLLHHTASPT